MSENINNASVNPKSDEVNTKPLTDAVPKAAEPAENREVVYAIPVENVNPKTEASAVTPVYATAAVPAKKHSYSKSDTVFAWISAIIGYLICRLVPVEDHTLGAPVFSVLLYAATYIILAVKKVRFNAMSILASVIGVALSAGAFISDDAFISFFVSVFSVCAFIYFVYSATGNSLEKGMSNFLAADLLRALFILPFYSFANIFAAAFSVKNKGGIKTVGKVFLGIALAIVPTAAVIVLLSYDSQFSRLMSQIFDFNLFDIFSHIGSFILGIPLAMYIFGLYFSGVNNSCKKVLKADSFQKAGVACKIAPASVVLSAVLPILLVYAVFFVSQWQYYISGFTGVLPEEFSYSEYAREGFFQLCAVSVINIIIIKMAALFMKRNGNKISALQKTVSVLYIFSTLVLISTALAKMVMYIDIYGLTRKRVYASVFIIMIAIVFMLEVIGQFATRFKAVPISVIICSVIFLGISLCDINGFIMKYNVDRYIDGSLETVDIDATYELGDSAVVQLVRLAEHLEDKYNVDITKDDKIRADRETKKMYEALYDRLIYATRVYDEDGLFSQSVPKLRAKAALKSIGYDERSDNEYSDYEYDKYNYKYDGYNY